MAYATFDAVPVICTVKVTLLLFVYMTHWMFLVVTVHAGEAGALIGDEDVVR